MAAAATPVTNRTARLVVERINQYRHGLLIAGLLLTLLLSDRSPTAPLLLPYCSMDGVSAFSAMPVSVAGVASLLRGAAFLPLLPAPLPAAFPTLFLTGFAFLAAPRAILFSTFFPALFTDFFSTFP